MESMKILDQILKNLREKGSTQVSGYNRFGYIRETDTAVIISREAGEDTRIPFSKILECIKAVQDDASVYDGGPSKLRAYALRI